MMVVRFVIGALLSVLLLAYRIDSFVFHNGGFNPTPRNHHHTGLFAVADPPLVPAEFQDEEESIDGNSDWIPTKGGFIANLRTKKRKRNRNKVQFVDNIEDYKSEVVDERNRIVVVRFYASWCRSCKASEPLFKRMVDSYESGKVKFVEVPLTRETAYIQEGLGVPSVPYGHIYHPEAGLVEEMKISKPNFREFGDVLRTYVVGSCELNSKDFCERNLDESDIGEFE